MTTIVEELRECADVLGRSIEQTKERLREQGIEPMLGQDTNGRHILGDMYAARGQVLAALAAVSP